MGSNKSRQIIFDHIPENGIGAEIGVWKGDFTMKLLEQTTPSTLHLIDPWAYQPDFGSSWYGNENMTADKMEEIYMDVLSRFANEIRDQQVFVHRLPSDAAAAGFEDEYFDWVYIDGNHDYEFVLKDLESYFPKVKTGGYITGDDYGLEGWWDNGVEKAVKDFTARVGNKIEFVGAENYQFVLRKL